MKHIKSFNENLSIEQHNQNYRELANILQSEVLDDYDIYEGYLSEKRDENGNFTNKPCWSFTQTRFNLIYNICIYPKNRLTKEGEETVKNLYKDIESLKSMINDFLGIEFDIEDHYSFLLISLLSQNKIITHFSIAAGKL
jgi:hypothetical protein